MYETRSNDTIDIIQRFSSKVHGVADVHESVRTAFVFIGFALFVDAHDVPFGGVDVCVGDDGPCVDLRMETNLIVYFSMKVKGVVTVILLIFFSRCM